MLKWLRRSTRSWFIYLAIGAIVVVFIFWGVGSYKASRSQEAAEVNGAIIPMTGQDVAPPSPFGDNQTRTADMDFDKRIDIRTRIVQSE